MNLYLLAVLILACSSLTFTITKGKVFERFRNFVTLMSPFLGTLVNCPYCTLHWVLFVGLLIAVPAGSIIHVMHSTVFDFIFTWFASVYIGAILINILRASTYKEPVSALPKAPAPRPKISEVKTGELGLTPPMGTAPIGLTTALEAVPIGSKSKSHMPSAYEIQLNVLKMAPAQQTEWFRAMYEIQDITYQLCEEFQCPTRMLLERILEKESSLVKA